MSSTDLDCLPQIITTPLGMQIQLHSTHLYIITHLFFNHLLVDLARRDVVITRKSDIEVTFIVSEVEVHFSSVIKNVNLA
jgi:hypothetical protein